LKRVKIDNRETESYKDKYLKINKIDRRN